MDTEMNRNDKHIDELLSEASPRPVPRGIRKERIYEELRGEWLANNLQTKRKRQYLMSGIAASILVAALLALQLNVETVDLTASPNAVLARTTGTGTTVNGRPIEELIPVNAPLRLKSGDTIATGPDAAIAIGWSTAGSLRMGAASELMLVSNDRVKLPFGQLYYDSRSFNSQEASPIEVETGFGLVRHVGTQFLANVDNFGTRISVREGQVTFENAIENVVIESGKSAYINKALSATISSIDPSDDSWTWPAKIAPNWDVDGRSTLEIIEWLARETGREIKFKDELARQFAASDRIRGIGEIGPLRAMSIIPIATELEFDVSDSSIQIRTKAQ